LAFIDSASDLAVEIVSPDSVGRDYVQKRAIYERSGVLEYWIIDLDEKRATFLFLQGGRYEAHKSDDHIIVSKALPGFRLDERWLWKTARPRVHDVLRWIETREPLSTPTVRKAKR